MSGYTENVIGHNGMLDAGIRLLQKPFNLRDLKSIVREVLDATPTPPEVVMNTQSAQPQSAAARHAGNPSHPRATIPTSLASALSPSRRENVARRHHRKHQPLRNAFPSRRSPAAQRSTGNQSRAPSGNRRTISHRSSLPRRSRPHHRAPRRHPKPRPGRPHPAIPLPARPAPQGVGRRCKSYAQSSQHDCSVADDARKGGRRAAFVSPFLRVVS